MIIHINFLENNTDVTHTDFSTKNLLWFANQSDQQ